MDTLSDKVSVGTTDEQGTSKHEWPEVPFRGSRNQLGCFQVLPRVELEGEKLPIFRCEHLG
jgi:hypothetical protein